MTVTLVHLRPPTAFYAGITMSRQLSNQALLKRAYDSMLVTDIGPFLAERGFAKSGSTFGRRRGPLYDVIGFQSNWHNGVTPWHAFFVNVGVGSVDIDAACPGHGSRAHPANGQLLDRRWEALVPELPYELRFHRDTDMTAFSAQLRQGLGRVIAELEKVDSTETLVRYAVEHNLLIQYEKTCCYLAATDDIERLCHYVATLRDCFGHQERWSLFNQRISAVTGPWTSRLRELGMLDQIGELTAGS
ncbi:hypothetical protein NGTWS0302_01570 [Mycolicibacterium cyprinidarum]|uniref:DUF4304 domain-containing protein n=1 Tax=Mycolicibacterium cyprinidarum TaxID=2860311 RepID=A0ABQ4VBG8_9MYCO|nr:hypothetical protein NGTWS0302_01570 [Mycolicibacterium sp. NGTWS0302]GJF12899.1 hypothetical protein NGTWS1702_12420 [Mycolicibacterium sp. NGTWSNA01]